LEVSRQLAQQRERERERGEWFPVEPIGRMGFRKGERKKARLMAALAARTMLVDLLL
jgi:hypothetical protein